jgi:protoporphyrinogen/coproporphyrinogen III oxidase
MPPESVHADQTDSAHSSQDLAGCRYGVVGGGLSGLAAAWYLQRRGAQTHIFERDQELGGRAASGRLGERVVTLGGKNIGRAYQRFRAFTASNGEHPYEHFGINSSRVLDGRVVRFDSEHRARLLREAPKIRPLDAVRLARLVRLLRQDPASRYLEQDACRGLAERYGGRTLEQVFGRHVRELILRSLTVRLSAAEPDEVPLANALPYVAMLMDTYDQLSGGMHQVVAAAAEHSRVSLGADVRRLIVEDGAVRGVETATQSGEIETHELDGVVLATHAHAAAALLAERTPGAAVLLREIRYFPLLVLLVEYERPVFTTGARAVVFGPEMALSNAGAYGVEDLNIVRYTFSGRRARSLTAAEPDPESLAAVAEATLSPYAAVSGNRRRALVARRFLPGLCAYHTDQERLLAQLGPALASLPGLSVTGDYLRGCSIEACFAAAERVVAGIPAERSVRTVQPVG